MRPVTLTQGQVWDAWVPFHEKINSGRISGKFRPVIILGWALGSDEDKNILVTYSTQFNNDPSKAQSNDYKLTEPEPAGLSNNSFIRCGRLMSISTVNIKRTGLRGNLSDADFKAVIGKILNLFEVPHSGTFN